MFRSSHIEESTHIDVLLDGFGSLSFDFGSFGFGCWGLSSRGGGRGCTTTNGEPCAYVLALHGFCECGTRTSRGFDTSLLILVNAC